MLLEQGEDSKKTCGYEPSGTGDASSILVVWEKAIDLQMHFNEMCMNLRRTAMGTLGALLATSAIAFRFGGMVLINGKSTSIAIIFLGISLFVWVSFYLMDRFWYHALLRATVSYAEGLAAPASRAGLGVSLNMSTQIREANHHALGLSGAGKINLFYWLVGFGLMAACMFLYMGVLSPIGA